MPFSHLLRRGPGWRGLVLALLLAAPGASASQDAAAAEGPRAKAPADAWVGLFCPPRGGSASGAAGFAAAAAAAAILSRRRERPARKRGGPLP